MKKCRPPAARPRVAHHEMVGLRKQHSRVRLKPDSKWGRAITQPFHGGLPSVVPPEAGLQKATRKTDIQSRPPSLATLEQHPCPSRPISHDDSAFLIPSSRHRWRAAETLRSSSPPFPMRALWDSLVQ